MVPFSTSQVLPQFNQASLLVVGDVMLDRYWLGDTRRVSPEAPVPIVHVQDNEHRPGGAANVACNIRALGAHVTLLGVIGDDEAGKTLQQDLHAIGVNASFYQSSQLSTIVKLRVLSRHQQILRMDFEKPYLDEALETELLQRFKKALGSTQLVILSDYQKGTLRHPAAFIQLASQAGIPVLVDPKSSDVSLYRGATWLTPNMKELEAMVGDCSTEAIMIEKGRLLLKTHDIKALLVTQGELGMTLITEHEVLHLAALAHEIYDVTGAGDTVISTLGTALAAGASAKDAMYLSNIAAGIAVTKLGATAISMQELVEACFSYIQYRGIVDEMQLCHMVQRVRASGKKIVFTNGCYDIIHAGHVKSLEMAKALGDYLIVAVNTDESVRALKGHTRPINTLADRMTVLAGFNAVDWVIPFADSTPNRLLSLIKPDVLAKGGDYTINEVVGADLIKEYGGDVHVLQHGVMLSTTDIIHKIQSFHANEASIEAIVEDHL